MNAKRYRNVMDTHHSKQCVVCFGCGLVLLVLSGCGSAFGERIYTEQTQQSTGTLPESPLPALVADEKLVAGPEKVLWGRLVIQGEAAKPELAELFLIPAAALENDPAEAESDPFANGGYSTKVLNKEGLYIFKGVKEGSYKLCLRFARKPMFEGKLTAEFTDPRGSRFLIEIVEPRTYQDIVVNLRDWNPKK